jgi:uncharacterized protein YecE (DUF72 family)
MRIGTAGWSLSREVSSSFPHEGTHLQRYARVMRCAEIDSSFHRPHRLETYAKWAAQTPPDFRFAVKLPGAITHDARLRRARAPLARFLAEAGGLGDRLAVLLVQLPPSLPFEARPVRGFFALLDELNDGRAAVVCEPRHASWFTPAAERALVRARVGRVAADPARSPGAGDPGGWLGPAGDGRDAVVYFRWHGSPRMYWSRYDDAWLAARAGALAKWPPQARWCIFDNTGGGGALPNALNLAAMLR